MPQVVQAFDNVDQVLLVEQLGYTWAEVGLPQRVAEAMGADWAEKESRSFCVSQLLT